MNTSSVRSSLERLGETRRHHGMAATLGWCASRVGEKLLRLEAAELLWLDAEIQSSGFGVQGSEGVRRKAEGGKVFYSTSAAMPHDGFQFRFLTSDEIEPFAIDPANDLDPDALRRAASGRHFCFAALDESAPNGKQLASYSWYAPQSIEAEHNLGVAMSYLADTVYMYKAFTRPEYRGRRLYGTGIAMALQSLGERGITKLVTTVHWNNFASLASCRRLGFTPIGRMWTLGHGRHRWAIKPHAAKEFGISFPPSGE